MEIFCLTASLIVNFLLGLAVTLGLVVSSSVGEGLSAEVIFGLAVSLDCGVGLDCWVCLVGGVSLRSL